ncbi:methyltransferase domain-containing protein [Shewanella schlegeliana]|uniref:Methyltransferase domain-containing protein n=1 Tax=Shewanella schlegeliana TaxID=190308 RepID=A0ABS1T4Q1_9GAMM|nr:methyltransferase domain-containing protein [Shewanella schlegeliana]MBL4915124.1 methyltransferase domain-containing protein [Shewanella schlegeliana]MCL1111009.1 methyltransferase domain-containing protein [Shewanella schlegeliana]GIU29227.1 malonyl-[acyl-carrier protein] O-methyltransferase [Shewanella schlegeliana]
MNTGSNKLNLEVAERFSAAAAHYHSYDVLQQQTAKHLLALMTPGTRLLDIGAGPGTDFSNFSAVERVYCLDIANGMLKTLNNSFPHYTPICGDAQNLPIASGSVDSIYSNVALQWCLDLPKAVSEANRVLTQDGELNMSIVAKGSLMQLSELGFKVNSFIDEQELRSYFYKVHWQLESFETKAITVYFTDLRALLQSIKGVGASIVKQQQGVNQPQVTLRGRKDWQALQLKAELNRAPEGLPLTYNISFIKARKKR